MKVLLVEDDELIGKAVKQALTDNAYAVDWVRDGNTALETLKNQKYDLMLLDIGLPHKNGLEVLTTLRQKKENLPIIIITARDNVLNKINGLDIGADDYLTKPFSSKELMARMRAIIRRNHGFSSPILSNGKVSLNPSTFSASNGNITVTLTAKEFSLLHSLLIRPGSIFSRFELETKIYGWNEEVESNAVEFLIYSLRQKLGKDVIKNIRGAGWLVAKEC